MHKAHVRVCTPTHTHTHKHASSETPLYGKENHLLRKDMISWSMKPWPPFFILKHHDWIYLVESGGIWWNPAGFSGIHDENNFSVNTRSKLALRCTTSNKSILRVQKIDCLWWEQIVREIPQRLATHHQKMRNHSMIFFIFRVLIALVYIEFHVTFARGSAYRIEK